VAGAQPAVVARAACSTGSGAVGSPSRRRQAQHGAGDDAVLVLPVARTRSWILDRPPLPDSLAGEADV